LRNVALVGDRRSSRVHLFVMIRTQPLYNAWVTWNDETLEFRADTQGKSDAWRCEPGGVEEGVLSRDDAADVLHHWEQYQDNALAYFLPHGRAWSARAETVANGMHVFPASDYPKKFGNDGLAFINDYHNDICLLMGNNQGGKSYQMTAWTALRILQGNPEWHCVKNHGVILPEWHGPRHWVIGSYSWDNVTTIWQRIKMIFPKAEMGKWVEKDMSFLGGGTKILTCQESKSTIRFLSYTQAQAHYEGFSCDGAGLDEQTERKKLIGIIRGMTTGHGDKQIGMAMTGHVMDDRPDTGAVGWIKRDIYDPKVHGKENSFGFSVGLYFLSVDSTPDAIVTADTKRKLYRTWADPDVDRTEQQINEGVARYWGGWEQGGGLMIPEWRRNKHVIAPLWDDDSIPPEADLYRAMDHGESSPTSCAWLAMIPAKNQWCDYSFSVLYRLYYERNVRPATSAPAIIELSGNKRVKIGRETDDEAGATYDVFEERWVREHYIASVLDSRSWSYKGGGTLIGALYQRYGLECGQAHGGKIHSTETVKGNLELLRDHLTIDPTKKHIVTGELGAPRLYVFDLPCTRPFVAEIEAWAANPLEKNKPLPRQDEHSIKCMIYWAAMQPQPSDSGNYERGVHEAQSDNDERFNYNAEVLRG